MKSLGFVLILFFIFSCSSDDTDTTDQTTVEDNFYALTVGNRWVYKNYRYNSNTESYEDTGVIDSISIISTEEFNGYTYYKLKRKTTGNDDNVPFLSSNGESFEYLRDSLGYLVRNDGWIKFTNNDYTERTISAESWGTIYEILIEGESSMAVEAGEFTCINSERFARDNNNEQLSGLDRYYYADGIGLVFNTCSVVNYPIPQIETHLDSYVIN